MHGFLAPGVAGPSGRDTAFSESGWKLHLRRGMDVKSRVCNTPENPRHTLELRSPNTASPKALQMCFFCSLVKKKCKLHEQMVKRGVGKHPLMRVHVHICTVVWEIWG